MLAAVSDGDFCDPVDVDRDGAVSPQDALIVINYLNDPAAMISAELNLDVNGSGETSPIDALVVINRLNAISPETIDEMVLELPAVAATQRGVLAGDYDENGVVDQIDYDLWASTFGSTTDLAADGNGNGIVDAADITIWRDNLGNTLPDIDTVEVLWGVGDDAVFAIDVDSGEILHRFDSPVSPRLPDDNSSQDRASIAQLGDTLLILERGDQNSIVYETDLDGNLISTFDTLGSVTAFDVLDNGNLVVATSLDENISIVDRSGVLQSSFSWSGTETVDSLQPTGISTNGVDEIYLMDFQGLIRTFGLDGVQTASIETVDFIDGFEFAFVFFGFATTDTGFFTTNFDFESILKISDGELQFFADPFPVGPIPRLQSLDIGRIPVPEPSTAIWTLTNREFDTRDLHAAADGNADLALIGSANTQWEVTETGDGATLRNIDSGEYLASENFEAFTTPTAGANAFFNIVDNPDGSISLQNIVSGRFLDGDGAGEGYDVDESVAIGLDDGWFVTDLTNTGDGVVTGFVYSDADANGERLAGTVHELGLSQRTVWIDVNGNGLQDIGEPFDITDENGEYRIDNSPLGSQTVRFAFDDRFTGTTPGNVTVDVGLTETVVDFGQTSPDEPFVAINGDVRLQNRETGEFLLAEFERFVVGDPLDPTCVDGNLGRVRTHPTANVDLADLPFAVQICGTGGTDWTFTTDANGTLVSNVALLNSVSEIGHLVSRAPFSLHMSRVPEFRSQTEPAAEDYWGIVLNDDRSISLQNRVNGQYIDADGDGSVDLSQDLLNDDGWFVIPSDTVSVSGVVFSDADQNGERLEGVIHERGLADRVVWVDLDQDGVQDAGEPFDVTDEEGNYLIENAAVEGDTFVLQSAAPVGWISTSASLTVDASSTDPVDLGQYSSDEPHVAVDGVVTIQNQSTSGYLAWAFQYFSAGSGVDFIPCFAKPVPIG